jgi:RNA polymerase-binding transcription factor DksA
MGNNSSLVHELRARRKKLVKDSTGIKNALDTPPSKDWEDRSSERQGDEVLEAFGSHRLNEVRKIDAALLRAQNGTFRVCVQCGANIREERLSICPRHLPVKIALSLQRNRADGNNG